MSVSALPFVLSFFAHFRRDNVLFLPLTPFLGASGGFLRVVVVFSFTRFRTVNVLFLPLTPLVPLLLCSGHRSSGLSSNIRTWFTLVCLPSVLYHFSTGPRKPSKHLGDIINPCESYPVYNGYLLLAWPNPGLSFHLFTSISSSRWHGQGLVQASNK